MKAFRWLGKNFSTFLLAFGLALVVWVSAVVAADPNQELALPRPIPIEVIGQDPALLIMGDIPNQVRLTLNAPRSIWTELTGDTSTIRSWIDLSGLGPGEYTVPVHVQISLSPVQIVQMDPESVSLTLEPLVSKSMPVTLEVEGTPALGYKVGNVNYEPSQVTVSGAESLVSRVEKVLAVEDVSEATQTIETTLPLRAMDINEEVVAGVSILPGTLQVQVPVELLGEYRNVIVKVITTGQVANGYKLTNLTVTPPNVIVFSSNPLLLNLLPGYVETESLDLTGLEDDIETLLELDLPTGISVINDQRVVVQVSVAAIESNIILSLPVEVIGLSPGLETTLAPQTVDVILSGPVPVLDSLKPADIRVIVNLSGLDVGTYQLSPQVDFLPPQVKIESILPSTLEVVISLAPTPTSTPTLSPFITPTPSP